MAFWKKKKKRQTTAKKKTHAASPKTNPPKMKPVPEWKPTISMPTYKPPSISSNNKKESMDSSFCHSGRYLAGLYSCVYCKRVLSESNRVYQGAYCLQ